MNSPVFWYRTYMFLTVLLLLAVTPLALFYYTGYFGRNTTMLIGIPLALCGVAFLLNRAHALKAEADNSYNKK